MKAGRLFPLLILLAGPILIVLGESGLAGAAGRAMQAGIARGQEAVQAEEQAASQDDDAGRTSLNPPEPRLVPEPSPGYNLRVGMALFNHYCLPCHGVTGAGDGFNAFNLDPRPRDLGDPGFQKERSDQDLLAIIRSGGGAAGLSTGMPPWGRTLNQRQMENLVR
ncbi:MAG: c-type cytochrome, partial [Acidobacteriota bacterium]